MNTLSPVPKHLLWVFVVLSTYTTSFAQSWLELREQGANFNDIKAAFNRDYGNKLTKMTRELSREATQSGAEKPSKSDNFERQMEGMIQYMRWSHFVEPRVKAFNGDLNGMSTGIAQALVEQSRRAASARTGANWSLIGPKSTPTYGGNGRINAVRAHPSVVGTLFACSPAGGLWKSVNTGNSWTPITENIAVLGATDVAFDPVNPNIMYLATGDGEAGDAYATGIYKSTDGGNSWSPTGLTFAVSAAKRFSKLLVNPKDNSILAGGGAGIYRSTNGGSSWTQVNTTAVRDLEFQPDNPSVVYAGGYTSTGFLRSTDGGATWASSGTGLPTSGVQRIALAVTPLDATYVYALVAKTGDYGFNGLYLSTDGGLTFSLKTSTPNILGWDADGSDAGGQGWYDLSLVVDPSVKTTIYTGGVNIWKSVNSGTTFTCVAHWSGSGAPYAHADVHDLTFIGSTLYAGNDGGVFSSENNGATWLDRSSTLAIAQIYSFGISQTNPNLILSGHQDNGTNLTTDGVDWYEVNGGDGMMCFIDRTNDNQMFSSIYNGALYRSTNGGFGFSKIYTVPSGGWVTPWLQDPVEATTLYAGGTSVYKSTNSGTAWSSISSFSVGTLVSLDVAKSNNQHILAASGSTLMRTTNGGSSWTNITTGLPSGSIQSVYYNPLDANKIYVALANYTGKSVYYSGDEGTTWTNISAGLPSVPATSFVMQSDNGDLYCGTDIGVYLRSAGASTWTAFMAGMPGIPVFDLDIYVPTGKLRAATYARGIWESTLNSINTPPSVSLTQPANNAVIGGGSNINLAATATDLEGTIAKVEFYQGATLLGTSTTAPYTFTWVNPPVGSYILTAKAYDNLNATANSTAINITVAYSNDAGITSVISPTGNTAQTNLTPSVILTNFGINTLTSTTISYKFDANAFTDYAWTGSLASGATTTVNLPTLTGYAIATHTFTAQTGTVNGAADNNSANNAATSSFTLIPQPTSGTATISVASACFGTSFTLSSTGMTTTTGTTYQWQKSIDNGTNWVNINAATTVSITLTATTSGLYQLLTTLAGATVASNTVSLTVVTPTYATVPYTQNFESWTTSTCVTSGTTNDAPSVNWQNTPVTGVNSWRRNDEGVTTAAWESLTGAYSPAFQSGTYSARFHSYRMTGKGTLDLFIDLSSAATKNLSFYYINSTGTDTLRILVSTDSGQTFTQVGSKLTTASAWTLQNFTLPVATATSVIRFEASGGYGSNDIGIDNLNVTPVSSVPSCISAGISPASNATGVCPKGVILQWNAVAGASSYDIYTNLPNVTSPINVVGTTYAVVGNLGLNTTYTWQVVPKNSIGSATSCAVRSFTTNATLCYCTPTYSSNCGSIDVMTRVQLGALDNQTGTTCGINNYTYYGAVTVPILPQAIQQSLSITFGNDATQFAGAWIDYNQNGVFESTEYLGGNNASGQANGTITLNFTVPNTALTGQTVLRIRGGDDSPLSATQSCGASSSTYGQTEDYRVNIVTISPCSGAPAANTTLSNATLVCGGDIIRLSLQNSYALTGISYQWQSALNGSTWTDISGATNATLSQTINGAINYRCAISCSGGAAIYSTPVSITLKTGTACYCAPIAACSTGYIDAVTVTSTPFSNTASGCSNPSSTPSSYIVYPTSTTTATLEKGTIYNLNVTTNLPQIVSAWIDYNHNGLFEANEWTQVSGATTPNVIATKALTIPINALIGTTLMRIRSRTSGSANSAIDACLTFGSGETEDYTINITETVLPVEFTSITAYAKGNSNLIDWTTASEKNLKAFIVERSTDTKAWQTIATVAPKGGTKATNYSIIDAQPLLLSYYRILTIDLDGQEGLSKIVTVKRFDTKQLTVLSVAPVPTTEGVIIEFSVDKSSTLNLTLTNIIGQKVKQMTVSAIEGTNKVAFNLHDLPNGTYLLNVSDGLSNELKRVVKQ